MVGSLGRRRNHPLMAFRAVVTKDRWRPSVRDGTAHRARTHAHRGICGHVQMATQRQPLPTIAPEERSTTGDQRLPATAALMVFAQRNALFCGFATRDPKLRC